MTKIITIQLRRTGVELLLFTSTANGKENSRVGQVPYKILLILDLLNEATNLVLLVFIMNNFIYILFWDPEIYNTVDKMVKIKIPLYCNSVFCTN